MEDYQVNVDGIEKEFDGYGIVVSDDADVKDESYWDKQSLMALTSDEIEAYSYDDSMRVVKEHESKTFFLEDAIGGKTMSVSGIEYDVPGIFNLWHYNRVEGASVGLPFSLYSDTGRIRSFHLSGFYGFADRKFKVRSGMELRLSKKYGHLLELKAYDDVWELDRDRQIRFSTDTLITSFTSLLYAAERDDYYYRKGGSMTYSGYTLPFLHLSLDGRYEKHESAYKNTDWSLFNENKKFQSNPEITAGEYYSVGMTMKPDFRPLAYNAGIIERLGIQTVRSSLSLQYTKGALADRTIDFTKFVADISGEEYFGLFGVTRWSLSGGYSNKPLPFQHVFTVPGCITGLSEEHRFRTLQFRELGGDALATAYIEHTIGVRPFAAFRNVRFIETSMWEFVLFGGAAWSSMRQGTRSFLTEEMSVAKKPFFEVGIGLKGLMGVFRVDFAWRLNHFNGNGRNFFVGLNLTR